AIRMNDAEVHLRVAHRTYPAAKWPTSLDHTADGAPGWYDYLEEMYRHVSAKDFWTKEVYLRVRLWQRTAGPSRRLFSQICTAYQRTEQLQGINDGAVDDRELARWTDQAERLGRALAASSLHARHATSDEVAWLIRHAVTGSAEEPRDS